MKYRIVCNETDSRGHPVYYIEREKERKRRRRTVWEREWIEPHVWWTAHDAQRALEKHLRINERKKTFVPHVVAEYREQMEIHDDYQMALDELNREIPNVL